MRMMKGLIVAFLGTFFIFTLFVTPTSAEIYPFNLLGGQWTGAYYRWDTGGTRVMTLWLRVDWGVVDIYFFNKINYDYYVDYVDHGGSILPYALFKAEGQGIGQDTWNFNFNPVAGAYYYVVIDDTSRVGSGATTTASGFWELTAEWPSRLMYGVVYEKIGEYGTNIVVPYAAISLSPGGYSTFADSNGHYSLSIPDGTYTATVSKSGYNTLTQSVTISGFDAQVNFYLPVLFYWLSGHVYIEGTSTPIVGATVTAGPYSATTDATGYYQVSVRDGTYNVQFSAAGYVDQTKSVTISGANKTLDAYMVVPEFPSLLMAVLFMMTTLLAVIVCKKKACNLIGVRTG